MLGIVRELPMLRRKISPKQTILAAQNRREKEYWLNHLSGIAEKTAFPYDYAGSPAGTGTLEAIRCVFPAPLAEKLWKLSNHSDLRLHMILLAGVQVLLHKYTAGKDLLLSTPVYQAPDLADAVNEILPIRGQLPAGVTFKALLLQTRQTLVEADTHKNYPVELVVDQLDLPFVTEPLALFNTWVVLENVQSPVRPENYPTDAAFAFARRDDAFSVQVTFNAARYQSATAERWIGHLERVFEAVSADPDIPIGQISILTVPEFEEVVHHFNATRLSYPPTRLVAWFEEQVRQRPEAIALFTPESTVRYGQLNEKANQLARYLQRQGVQPHDLVGILLPRSEWLVISMLAILKAGAAYVPMDPAYPVERVKFMLEDARLAGLLSTGALAYLVPEPAKLLRLETIRKELRPEDAADLANVAPGDRAYIIYTSGSTGKPKGIAIRQDSVVNLLQWGSRAFSQAALRGVLASTSVCFDLSVFEIFMPLTHGGAVILAENLLQLPTHPYRHQVTLVNTVPSVLTALLRTGALPSSVQVINLAGEPLRRALVDELFARHQVSIYNLYGPSETTTYSTYEKLVEGDPEAPTIGKPLGNTQVYLLDEGLNPVPVGIPGELYIGGAGVAREYVNLPELTQARFLANPFVPGQRMYKTGDWGKWLPDGRIVYGGRMDHQVKIRGFRIELGEIEHCLLSHPEVKEAIVIAKIHPKAAEEKYLCAFVLTRSPIAAPALKAYLRTLLPAYMIPAHIVPLSRMPQTPSGKADRKALAQLYVKPPVSQAYRKAENELQQTLVALWQEVLAAGEVGIEDNFFELGGHSLQAYRIIEKIHQHAGAEVPVAVFFRDPTIAALSAFIREELPRQRAAIPRAESKAYYLASPPQKRIFVSHQFEPDGVSNNIPFILRISGAVDTVRLERAINQIVARHESLRTSFHVQGSELVQQIHGQVAIPLTRLEAQGRPPEALIGEFVRPFDLSRAPLLRLGWVGAAPGDFWLLMDMHHSISDGLSLEILVEELVRLYQGEALPALALQYKDFAEWQHGRAFREEVKQQEQYWLHELGGEIPPLQLPRDFRLPGQENGPESIDLVIPPALLHPLREVAAAQRATSFMVLFSVYAALLHKITGQTDLVIGSSVAGRPHVALQPLIGMFVNAVALRVRPAGHQTYQALLAETKQKVLKAYENQLVPFDELVNKLNGRRGGSQASLYRTNFLYFNLNKPAVEIPGLQLSRVEVDAKLGLYDLTVEAVEKTDHIKISLEYNAGLFRKETVEKWGAAYLRILTQVLNQETITLDALAPGLFPDPYLTTQR